jgi:hypothetical protein
MLLLVTLAAPTLEPHRTPSLGRLVQPRHCPNLAQTLTTHMPWAADNDCFQGLDMVAFDRMLDNIQTALVAFNDGERRAERWAGRPLFVNVPDVVASADGTLSQWHRWQHAVRRRGLPVGYVAQNGCELGVMPPWLEFDALFLGGDTAWKLGPHARSLTALAKRHGKHVHMGRVNTVRRLRYAQSIGVDSVDGTGWAKWRNAHLDAGLRALDYPQLALATCP